MVLVAFLGRQAVLGTERDDVFDESLRIGAEAMRYALAMVLVLAACQDDITTVFPDGLEPVIATARPIRW